MEATKFQALSTMELNEINGGNIAKDIGGFIPNVVEGAVNGVKSLVKSAYNAGKSLGSYIRNW